MPAPHFSTLKERFLNSVDQNGPVVSVQPGKCWLWTGTLTANGYGQVPFGKDRYAHRVSYRFFVGEIPPRKLIRHLCNNPPCVNPAHLAAGTTAENYQDAVEAGTAAFGERNGASKHSRETIQEIWRLHNAGMGQAEIGRQLGLVKNVVHCVVRGKRRRHG